MKGIDLNKPIEFLHSSLRFFSEHEHHITRFCKYNVLVMVFEGVLRFAEDGVEYEVHPGEYHIQKAMRYQTGENESSSPKYLYVHFNCEYSDDNNALPFRGTFDFSQMKALMYELDKLSHDSALLVHKTARFYELLLLLQKKDLPKSNAEKFINFINESDLSDISLEMLCERFHFSKNHFINIFKKQFGVTPTKYINSLKIKQAKYLLEVTSDTLDDIAQKSGFHHYSHFYKLFCRETGLSPAQWRKKKYTEPLL
ncbi:MAG: AraC family transcriptional regulator [Ruminococcaceae bacterium]|nr:AraC family transcriptional regulator [Oscillospiraceae bacterium]